MKIGRKIKVSTGMLTITALPTRANRLYTLAYKSDVSSGYDDTVQMSKEHLKQLIQNESRLN